MNQNEAVSALAGQVKAQPLTIDMSMYDDFEQVGELGTSLPAEDVQMETKPGDIMLYAGDKIVVFYGQNSWAYTPLGKIKDKTEEELAELEERIESVTAQNEELAALIKSDDIGRYMEKLAVENNDYAYPDEHRYYDTSHN